MALLVRPTRLLRSAIVLKPSTLLGLDKALSKQKYRMLFAPNRRRKPGPKGPSAELIRAVVEMKQRNPNWGCPRIAQQIALALQIQIDRDMVRRILAQRYRPGQDSGGPSWLTFLGHIKDSLWSIDLFRCESATLRTHWVLVINWTNTRAGSLGSASMPARSMVPRCVECSTAPFEANIGCRSTSALTMIPCIDSIRGWPTSGCWR
jgi:putative transposase